MIQATTALKHELLRFTMLTMWPFTYFIKNYIGYYPQVRQTQP
jgi:hypothetical protein